MISKRVPQLLEISSQHLRRCDSNLVPNEVLSKRKSVTPLRIYVGNNIFVQVKEYKKTLYIGFSKKEDGVSRNRFNIALEQLDKVEALQILKEHVRTSN